ncbi:hemerythrin domain-containing protein [Azohydromonas aeria]|uniref:hemerythrin domain-containing protein n=1 Tax=Azohydromonas aeria TaxID=2590212 RepID=UPI0012F919CC|nr:hemerythrin domain-containing protein [Azohydromonas aeria]
MNIDRFKNQHAQILDFIEKMRRCSHAGIIEHAEQIAQLIVAMSAVVKLHLAAEDQALHPVLDAAKNRELAHLGRQFQAEMASIASQYNAFARQWNTAARVQADLDGFRAQANQVLRTVFERMQRENRDFYPAVERGVVGPASTSRSISGLLA